MNMCCHTTISLYELYKCLGTYKLKPATFIYFFYYFKIILISNNSYLKLFEIKSIYYSLNCRRQHSKNILF